MRWFRSIFKRAKKPAVMALVAGSLAVSLTVTTTQKAEATPVAVLPVVAAAEAIVGGASIPLVMPSLLATSLALHPVGWAIAGGVVVAGLAVGAGIATKDYWLPYVTGGFGQGSSNENTPAGTGAVVDPYFKLDLISNGPDVRTKYVDGNATSAPANQPNTYVDVSAALQCREKADGSGAIYDKKAAAYGSYIGGGWNKPRFAFSCDAGYLTGIVVGAKAADPVLTATSSMGKGPQNVLRWGKAVQNINGFDPRGSDVKYRTTVECIDDNGVKSTITADWLGSDGGAKFPGCAAAGKGHGTGVNKIEGYAPTAPGQVGTQPETIWETKAPAVDPNYSKCDQGRPGPLCEMRITIDGKPCVVGQWECVNWSELSKDPNTAPRVGCTYGPYTLTVDLCTIMEGAYQPGGRPMTEENIDGDPSTRNNTDLSGEPFQPNKTQTAPVPGGAGTAPSGSSPEQQQCFPQGWAQLNPIEWVMKPVGCALDAAFKPKKDVQARITSMQGHFSDKVPISWFTVPGTGAVTGGVCPTNWALDISGQHVSLICGTPVEQIVLAFRPIMGAMLVMAALWPLIRSLFYAAIPIFKVTPS